MERGQIQLKGILMHQWSDGVGFINRYFFPLSFDVKQRVKSKGTFWAECCQDNDTNLHKMEKELLSHHPRSRLLLPLEECQENNKDREEWMLHRPELAVCYMYLKFKFKFN